MLFKSLALKNFKCFEEVEVEFAPITLLTGANSSGKSSLIYSLLAMLQTEQFPLYLSPNGKYVEMGSFKEMAFQNKVTKEIEIKVQLKSNRSIPYFDSLGNFNTTWKYNILSQLPIINSFAIRIGDGLYELANTSNNTYNFNYELSGFDDDNVELFAKGIDFYQDKPFLRLGKNESINNKLISFKEIPFESLKEFETFISNTIDINSIFISPITEYLGGYMQRIDKKFNYLGSFRLPPERTYYQKAKAQEKVGVNGEGYIDQIIEWEETDQEKFKEVNEIMADLELIQSIQSEKMKGGRFELTVKTKKNSSSASLTDVGFGISQFLPLIVADLQLPNTSCLALSQPEIHLHPKIQALFGNYLAKQINKSAKQYIVETHSEYLLNRIRLLLVKGELKPKDVRVYYFENDGIRSVVHNIEFTTDGQIKGAPDGFFDTYGMDVMDIALNA